MSLTHHHHTREHPPAPTRRFAPLLAACERRLEAAVTGADPALSGPALDILAAGGKRLRPALVFCCSGTDPRAAEAAIRAAATVEFLHMATLVHDDVIDRSPIRRGRPTVNAVHGPGRAVAVGDHLLCLAFTEAAGLGDPRAVAAVAQATLDLTRGELRQQVERLDADACEHSYLVRCRQKTGALLGLACRLGALTAGAPAAAQDLLDEFGRELGVAFQIVDDVLDITGPVQVTGKSLGDDLVDGTATLPLILCLRLEPGLATQMRWAATDAVVRERLCAVLSVHPGLEAARQRAGEHAAAALALLDDAGAGVEVEALRAIADGIVARLTPAPELGAVG